MSSEMKNTKTEKIAAAIDVRIQCASLSAVRVRSVFFYAGRVNWFKSEPGSTLFGSSKMGHSWI